MNSLKRSYFKSCALITVMALCSESAFAQTSRAQNIGAAADNLTDSLEAFPKLIQIVSYIAGLAFGIAGLIKLKEYMDKPGQGSGIKEPMGRLLIGALLVALPTVLRIITASSTGDQQKISLNEVGIS